MKVLELFCGAGGAYQGMHAAGWDHLACLDYNPAPLSALRRAGAPAMWADLSAPWTWGLLGQRLRPDVVWSSFPCQAFSTAGKRLGANDPRNGWPWTVGVVDANRPEWLLCENVSGLLQHSAEHCGDPMACPGCYFHRVILPELRERFASVQWACLDSADYGIPQHRRRVYIVAGPRPIAWPVATHGSPSQARQGGLFGASVKPWATVRDALGLGAGAAVIGGVRNPTSDPRDCRTYRNLTAPPCTTLAAVQIGNAGPWVIDPRHPPCVPDRPAPSIRSGGDGHSAPPMWLVAAGETGAGQPRRLTQPAPAIGTKGTAYFLDQPAPTVAAGDNGKGCGQWSANQATREAWDAAFIQATGRRRLTPVECRKLMGWAPEWDGYLEPLTKTQQYAAIGNGCTPEPVASIARAVEAS